MKKISRSRRVELTRAANDVRARLLGTGASPQEITDRICVELPELLPLEARRLAHGWSRAELSRRIDALYESDGLGPPHLSDSQLCKWEHGDVRPSDERLDYLTRLYETSTTGLGFSTDYSKADVDHLQQSRLANIFPRTNDDSQEDLLGRLQSARQQINIFGLTRNFYVSDHCLPLLERKAVEMPVNFYVMHPYCDSRRDRYRLEPAEAAMEDPERYAREFLKPLYDAQERVARMADPGAGFTVWTYNFPCAFAIEEIDDSCRVMLYGVGKRGTDGPLLVFDEGTPYHEYFTSQLRFLEQLASDPREPWISKDLQVRPINEAVA